MTLQYEHTVVSTERLSRPRIKMSSCSHTTANFQDLSLLVLGCVYSLILVDSLYKTFKSVWPGLADLRLRVHYIQILSVVVSNLQAVRVIWALHALFHYPQLVFELLDTVPCCLIIVIGSTFCYFW
jgi:hypothetical protein